MADEELTDLNGKQVHAFASQMANLGFQHMTDLLIAMFKSGVWRQFRDGLGTYDFLPGEFDYFLTQQGVSRTDIMDGVRDIETKAMLEAAMDERRTGEEGYRRRIVSVRDANPQRPGRPILPFGYTKREAKSLADDGVTSRTRELPALGSGVRRWTKTGGKAARAPARLSPAERARRIALRLTDDHLDQLVEHLKQEQQRQAWSRDSDVSPDGNARATDEGSQSDGAAATLRKRFQAEERQAITALARWIGHPAVRGVIERRRAGADAVVMPIGRLLTDQIQVIRFCWHVYGIAGAEPGWHLRRGEPWLLTHSEMSVIDRVEADFRGVVQLAVNELHGAGVGLVPSWDGDHVIVGELLLLDVDWQLSARELAGAMQPPAIGAIHIDASGTIHRRGTWEKAESNIAVLRRSYERHLHGPPPRAPYAGGGTRAIPESTRRRRDALRKVLDRWPDVTASRIYTTFGDYARRRGGEAATPGGYLRQLLEANADAGDMVKRPPRTTL